MYELSKEIFEKLLVEVAGESAKYAFKEYGEAGRKNLVRLCQKASACLQRLGRTEGSVPPRVLKAALEQGFFCEDEVQCEYLGCILALSKGNDMKDDRTIAYLALLDSMSTYQIRAHAIIYASALSLSEPNYYQGSDIINGKKSLCFHQKSFQRAMGLPPVEFLPWDSRYGHIFHGLEQKGLLKWNSRFYYYEVVELTPLGIELFLWGVGYGDKGIFQYNSTLRDKIALPSEILLTDEEGTANPRAIDKPTCP